MSLMVIEVIEAVYYKCSSNSWNPPRCRRTVKKSAAAAGGARKFRLAQRRAAFFPAAARIRFRLARRRNSAADRSQVYYGVECRRALSVLDKCSYLIHEY